MGCSLAVLVSPRGSLLFLTHVEARIRSRPFIVDAIQRRPRRRAPQGVLLGVCILFAPEVTERSEVRHVLVADCICPADPLSTATAVHFAALSRQRVIPPIPGTRIVVLAIRYRVQRDAHGSSRSDVPSRSRTMDGTRRDCRWV